MILIDYYPFGQTRQEETTEGYENDYKYTGKELDEDLDLYYYGARYYHPRIGRFVSVDPVAFMMGDPEGFKDRTGYELVEYKLTPQRFNAYSYAFNNPILYNDPTGESGTLTIYSSEGPGQGHSWISFISDDPGSEMERYGTWGNDPTGEGNGLFKNLEKNRTAESSRTLHINDEQENRLFNLIKEYENQGEDAWKLLAPCSDFASRAWKSGTGEFLNPIGIVNSPKNLKKSIIEANEGKNHNVFQGNKNALYESSNSTSETKYSSQQMSSDGSVNDSAEWFWSYYNNY